MSLIGNRRGEDIDVSSVAKLQSPFQLGSRQREIPHGYICLAHARESFLQVVLVHGGHPLYHKTTSRERFHRLVGKEQMAVHVCLCCLELLGEQLKAACLHDGGIRLV